jgi:gamma-glutamyltranspeptidase/glutathione hydrolase
LDRSDWQLRKQEAQSSKGMVVAKQPDAAEAGRAVLDRGGNAVDAAVATAFALGVVEPMMSGIGGGGYLIRHDAKTSKTQVINFTMIASEAAHEKMFELDETGGVTPGLFNWPKVKDDANIHGAKSVAVPGVVAGLGLALEKFGSGNITWAEALKPATKLADDGFCLNWHDVLHFVDDWDLLRRYPETAAVFLPNGRPPLTATSGHAAEILKQPALAKTLDTLAKEGPEAFYKGSIASNLAEYVTAHGGALTENDFSNYRPVIEKPLVVPYEDCVVYTPGGPSGGTSLAMSLNILREIGGTSGDLSDAETWHKRIEPVRLSFADRLVYLADPAFADVPYERLLSNTYAAERASLVGANALPYPAPAGNPNLAPVAQGPRSAESTTHLVVIDREHNLVAVTQTLLSLFGSGVLEPKTGVLLNNGMMWFDPEPKKANSVAARKRPLCNMTPIVATSCGRPFLALGASGGRRIQSAVYQVFLNIVEGRAAGPQAAMDMPRFDCSMPDKTLIEARVGENVLRNLVARGHKLEQTVESVVLRNYASPVGALVTEDGIIRGGSERWHGGIALGL